MKGQSFKNYLILGLVIMICCMGIGFAAFSTNLVMTANSVADLIKPASWNVNVTKVELLNEGGAVELVHPEIKGTYIGEWSSNFNSIGTTLKYKITVENKGDIDAKLNDIVIGATNVSNNIYTKGIETTLCHLDKETTLNTICNELSINLSYEDGSVVAIDDVLEKNSTKEIFMTVEYKQNQPVENMVTLTGTSIMFNYNQK